MSQKLVTFAIVLSTLISGVGSAKAEDSVRVNNTIYLSAGPDFNFKVFMNKKAKRFIKKNDEAWATFNNVVRLYNDSTGQFLLMSEDEKADFYEAVATITSKLSNMRNEDAQIWLKKVDVTEKVFAFLWENKTENKPFEELYELPTISVEPTVGR
ncbi:hypothetical protein [Jiulongibacter sediminis]|jgi:hypothetical protein|uniref:hypothetical protein n=1 Tax=Jiulongibacter sediminis TaxID=1605367 RepID=UPI0026EF01FB|nr:hypothetical protein [Jiulongibacter sediminis]